MRTIKLKSDKTHTIYISSITEKSYTELIAKTNNKLPINYNDIIGLVSKDDKPHTVNYVVKNLVDFFEATTKGERQIHFRDYTKSIERQKKMAWLINVGCDYRVSWKTLMLSLKSPDYCVIWQDVIDKKYPYVRKF